MFTDHLLNINYTVKGTSACETADNVMFVVADQDECQDNKGGCSHLCIDQPMGFICHCPDNMRLVKDSYCEGELHHNTCEVLVNVCVAVLYAARRSKKFF